MWSRLRFTELEECVGCFFDQLEAKNYDTFEMVAMATKQPQEIWPEKNEFFAILRWGKEKFHSEILNLPQEA